MKRILLALLLVSLTCNGFAQKGFGLDGTIGIAQNGGDLVYPFLIEGRIQFNDYFSMNLGLGLWNSGFKDSWDDQKTTTSTFYTISSNKTLPSVQLSMRGQVPVFNYKNKQVRFFAEPKLYFLPFSAQTVTLKEVYYKLATDNVTFTPTGKSDLSSMKSESHPRLYGGLQVGFAYEITDDVDLAVSYGYTNMDLFKDLRGRTMADKSSNAWSIDDRLPRKDLQQINVGFLINFNLN